MKNEELEKSTNMENVIRKRTWCNYVMETVTACGHAARRNRGRYTGSKIHKLCAEYIVGLIDETIEKPGSFGWEFKQTGRPVLFSCYPVCGCTQGQHAATPIAGLTAESVTCAKCAPPKTEVTE